MTATDGFDWVKAIGNIEKDIAGLEDLIKILSGIWMGSNDPDLLSALGSLGALQAKLKRKLVEAKHFRALEQAPQ